MEAEIDEWAQRLGADEFWSGDRWERLDFVEGALCALRDVYRKTWGEAYSKSRYYRMKRKGRADAIAFGICGGHSCVSSARRARARLRGTHSESDWNALVAACGGKCVACGAEGPLTKDHIVPVSRGGSDEIMNLQPLCKSCNASKSDREPGKDWIAERWAKRMAQG